MSGAWLAPQVKITACERIHTACHACSMTRTCNRPIETHSLHETKDMYVDTPLRQLYFLVINSDIFYKNIEVLGKMVL